MSLTRDREADAIARLLLDRRQVSAESLEKARQAATLSGLSLATQLLAIGAIEADALAGILGEAHGLESVTFAELHPTRETLAKLDARTAVRHLAVPLRAGTDGIEVAFSLPSDEAIAAVEKASGLHVRPRVASEPVIYAALAREYGLTRVPAALEPVVRMVVAGAPARPLRAVVPVDPDEYVTTPMGGAVPSLPDEVTTNPTLGETHLSPDDILLGAGSDDPFGRALVKVVAAAHRVEALDAIVEFAARHAAAAAILTHADGGFRVTMARGALEPAAGSILGGASRSVLARALGSDAGHRGPLPDTAADALVLEAIGREPSDLLVVRVGRADSQDLLWADVEDGTLDAARVEEIMILARRSRA